MKHALWIVISALVLSCSSVHATYITATHITQGPFIIESDASQVHFGGSPEQSLGSLIMPLGSVPVGPDGEAYHVVIFLDPATLLPTALVTCQALRGPLDIFMYISFAAEGSTSFASELPYYLNQPFTSTALADGTLQDISPLLDSGQLQFNMQISPVHFPSVPESGGSVLFLSLSLVTLVVFRRFAD